MIRVPAVAQRRPGYRPPPVPVILVKIALLRIGRWCIRYGRAGL